MIDDPKNRKIFLVQELMEGGALMPDSENCEPMGNEVSTLLIMCPCVYVCACLCLCVEEYGNRQLVGILWSWGIL